MNAIRAWFHERVPLSAVKVRELTNEPVPNHLKKWWFCLGGTPAYLFVVQIFTGILLAFYYEPSPATAYESVRYITEEAAFGWYIRSIHKWAATLMIAAVILHQIRIYFTGAYRKPREINWMIGCCLLMCVLMTGFTGYSLVYEQLSYWGATVGANIADGVPVIGGFAKQMLLAGESYNEHTLPRFYIMHAAVLPGAIILLLIVHIGLIRLQGVSELQADGQITESSHAASYNDQTKSDASTHYNFFPDHAMTELIIGLVLMVLLSALAIIFPATMGPQANPLSTPEHIKPEWFFYVTFRWLKMFSGTAAIISTGFIVFVMFVWPFIDGLIRRYFPKSEASVWIGIVGAGLLIGLTVYEAVAPH